ncbi:hypothetical protein [Cytophaga aurantiaca]|uniref:hypothetical protein n=1 Tax=Cytophaga aurantiaca TaxID=29530 RepID=UPI00036B21EF|nr:hypothetical protein [Cytophaga aurantiaca]
MKKNCSKRTTDHGSLTTIFFAGVLLVLLSCDLKHSDDRSPIQGTWVGSLDSTSIIEYKVYAPAIEDSLTRLKDSVYTMQNVLVDIGKEEVQFMGMRSVIFAPHLYQWEGRDTILFQRKKVDNEAITNASGAIVIVAEPMSYATIVKRNKDSLIMQLNVYNHNWKQYLLKLKRK